MLAGLADERNIATPAHTMVDDFAVARRWELRREGMNGSLEQWYGRVRCRISVVCDTCVMVAAMVARAGRQGEINAAQVRYTRRTWVAGKACRGSLPEASAPLHLRLRSFPSAAWRCSFSQRRHSASRCPSCRSSTIRRCPRSSRFIGPDYGRCRRLPSSHSPGLPRYDAPIS